MTLDNVFDMCYNLVASVKELDAGGTMKDKTRIQKFTASWRDSLFVERILIPSVRQRRLVQVSGGLCILVGFVSALLGYLIPALLGLLVFLIGTIVWVGRATRYVLDKEKVDSSGE